MSPFPKHISGPTRVDASAYCPVLLYVTSLVAGSQVLLPSTCIIRRPGYTLGEASGGGAAGSSEFSPTMLDWPAQAEYFFQWSLWKFLTRTTAGWMLQISVETSGRSA